MPTNNKRQHRIPTSTTKVKRARRITTVEDILARDDVNEILSDIDKIKPDISDIIIIYYDKDNNRYNFKATPNTLSTLAVWMLESVKLDILSEDE